MQQPAPSQPASSHPSFAGLLATLARPEPETRDDEPLWNSSGLGDDVATLSYERALRAHARYRPTNRTLDRALEQTGPLPSRADAAESNTHGDAWIEKDAARAGIAASAAVAMEVAAGLQTGTMRDRDLRSASVTVRLSEVESARLHRRSAEAGLTVSAYLRSCAVEAETLRAQVKQALAELKADKIAAKGQATPAENKKSRRSFFDWLRQLARRGR